MYLSKLIRYCILLIFSLFLFSCTAPKPSVWTAKDRKDNIKADELYTVKKGSVSIEASGMGMLVASKETSLYFNDVSGILKNIKIKVNDKVSKGDLIGEIESADLNEQLIQIEYDLQKAMLRLQQTELDIDTNKKELELAQFDLTYYDNLLKKQDTVENREMQKKTLLRVEQINNSLSSSKKNNEIAKIDIKSIESSKKFINKKLADCRLVSNLEGIVTFVDNFSLGDYIENNKIIGKLIEPKNMVLQFVAGNLNYFTGGMNVIVKINGAEYAAVVYDPMPGDLIKELDPQVKVKNQIYIKLDNPIKNLKLNEKVSTIVSTKSYGNTLVIPRSALRSNSSKYWVERYINGKLEEVDVVKGIESGSNVEILQGLNEGDLIIKGY